LTSVDGAVQEPPSGADRLRATRLLVGAFAFAYVLVRLRYFADDGHLDVSQLSPVGIVRLVPTMPPRWAAWAIALSALAAAGAFTAGKWPRVSGPALFATLLWMTTYRSSFGKILHTENLLVLHVGILALVPAKDDRDRSFVLRLASIATVLTYFVAGATKLRASGWAWLDGSALGDWLAFDALRKIELGSFHSPLAAWLSSRPALLAPLALFTLAVEIGAPLALLGRRIARAWAIAAWIFHVAVLATMAIGFFYPLSGVAFAPLFAVERLPLLRRLSSRADSNALP
jgi:hypothetical protein